jgi:hypothetical protein
MSDSDVRAYAAAKRFAAPAVDRWLALAPVDRDALLELAHRLRLGENQFRDVLDDLTAIAARRQCALADVAAVPEITALWERALGRNEALKALKIVLRRLRYPQLTAAEQRIAEVIRALRLPAGVRLEAPPNLEGDALTATVRGRSPDELRAQARALASALDGAPLDEIFALLEGRW